MEILSIMTSELKVLITELEARILKLEQDQTEREAKKNWTRCIQIAKEILRTYDRISSFFLEWIVQGAQHRLHSTSWYKDVKKLEDIVNRDRQKRCICQDDGIFHGMTKNRKLLFQKGYEKLRN